MSPVSAVIVPTTVSIIAPLPAIFGNLNNSSVTATIITPSIIMPYPTGTTTMGNNDDGHTSDTSETQSTGGYIIVVLAISLVIAIVYFSKIILTKRREKRRLSKEQDCEVPPGYANHVLDIQVYDRASGHFPSSETLIPIATVHSVQPPARAQTRRPRSSANPPAYEDLLGPPEVRRSPSSTSIVSDSTAAMEERNRAASNSAYH